MTGVHLSLDQMLLTSTLSVHANVQVSALK